MTNSGAPLANDAAGTGAVPDATTRAALGARSEFLLRLRVIVDKPGKGIFYATEADALLNARGITHLVFAGVTTEVCVQTSMREANDRGYECLLVEDATASYFPDFKAATLDMIRAQGAIVGWTTLLANLERAVR